ncbi:MAG: N-acetyltransferase [Nevskiaceae bacterium]|nr:MAG: N-acetyltransferase [Nevskiaceae bacterium]
MAGEHSIPAFLPTVLRGHHVTLEPLAEAHLDELCRAGADPAIFRWFPQDYAGPAAMRGFVMQALDDQRHARALPFAVRRHHDGRVVGSTRFCAIETTHRRAEIGWTWYAPEAQRTPVNTECKLLLLRHGFEVLALNRVEFKTDSLNQASRAALARIGAVQEGIFRNHMVVQGGRLRHSVYFSIVREAWPQTRAQLERLLARPHAV